MDIIIWHLRGPRILDPQLIHFHEFAVSNFLVPPNVYLSLSPLINGRLDLWEGVGEVLQLCPEGHGSGSASPDFSQEPGHFYLLLWIRILRIQMYLGLADPHPDSLVTTHKYESGSGSFHHQAKKFKKNLDLYCFCASLWVFASVPDPYVFGPPGSTSGSVRQMYRSGFRSHQNVTDHNTIFISWNCSSFI